MYTKENVIWSPHNKKHEYKLKWTQRLATPMVPNLEDLTHEERLKEIQLITLKERIKRGDLIIIYKLMNNLEETDRKDPILRRKREAEYLKGHKKNLAKINLLEEQKVQLFQMN